VFLTGSSLLTFRRIPSAVSTHGALLAAKGKEIVGLNWYKMRSIIIKDSKCVLFVCSEHGQLLALGNFNKRKTVSYTKHYYGIRNEAKMKACKF
jgi:hypothetical protein